MARTKDIDNFLLGCVAIVLGLLTWALNTLFLQQTEDNKASAIQRNANTAAINVGANEQSQLRQEIISLDKRLTRVENKIEH